MNSLQSRLWLPSAMIALALFLGCLLLIGVKGKNLVKQPSIQDVFTGETHEFTSDLGQLAKIVPPTNYVATPPENHGPQYRTVDWLKAQGTLAWTLQVFSSIDEDIVKSYLVQRDDKEQFAYFLYREGENTKYVVIYGNFVTMELALGVSNTMDFGLLNDARAAPEKFLTYVPHVPLIEQAIDRPPPPKYGAVPDVPIIPEETEIPVEEADLSEKQPDQEPEAPVLDLF